MKPSDRIKIITSEIVEKIIEEKGIGARNWSQPEQSDKIEAIIIFLDEIMNMSEDWKPFEPTPKRNVSTRKNQKD